MKAPNGRDLKTFIGESKHCSVGATVHVSSGGKLYTVNTKVVLSNGRSVYHKRRFSGRGAEALAMQFARGEPERQRCVVEDVLGALSEDARQTVSSDYICAECFNPEQDCTC